MTLNNQVLSIILERPGTLKETFCRMLNLSDYRLHRVFRHIQRDLIGRILVHDNLNGVWVVDVQPDRCTGMEWMGAEHGGYGQCHREPELPDGRCYDHSQCQNLEMVAFNRTLESLVSPCEPTAYNLSQLTLTVVADLIKALKKIVPLTRRDELDKRKFLGRLESALATLQWKDRMRRQKERSWIPPELFERHRQSSVNLFEYSLKKYFLVLEVAANSTRDQVLKAWRKLARRYHPDLRGGDEERMKAVNLAKDRIFRLKRWD